MDEESSQRSDSWMDETVPGRRVQPEGDEAGHDVRPAGHDVRPTSARSSAVVWLLGVAVVLVALAVCGLWTLYLTRGRFATRGPTPSAIVWTPTPAPTPTATPTLAPTEASDAMPTVSPEIAVGSYVQVAGTGGLGLNLRSGPGQDYERIDIALDGEVFVVTDGPSAAGDSQWWKVRDPEDEAREWWAIANFLEPVEQP